MAPRRFVPPGRRFNPDAVVAAGDPGQKPVAEAAPAALPEPEATPAATPEVSPGVSPAVSSAVSSETSVPEAQVPTFRAGIPLPPWDGRPEQYVVVRTRNHGWVIDERWQRFASFDAIEDRIRAENAAGHAGTLTRGNRVLASWGGEIVRL